MNGVQIKGFRERIHRGHMDYLLGNHPTWEIFRSFYQTKNRPYVIGGLLILLGYLWDWARHAERTIPEELMDFRRREQMSRLKSAFFNLTAKGIPNLVLRGHKAVGE